LSSPLREGLVPDDVDVVAVARALTALNDALNCA